MQEEDEKSMLKRLTVVNRYNHEATSNDVYIGRGSPFGNPYSHLASDFKDTIKCNNREESIELFKEYFNDIVNGCGCKNKPLRQKLRDIIIKIKLGGEVNLVCFCKPKTCHGDIIRNYILKELGYDGI